MSLEQSIQNLADAINRLANMTGASAAVGALAAVATSGDASTDTAEPQKRGRGRPPKATSTESSAPAASSVASEPAGEAEVAAPAAAVAPSAAPAAASPMDAPVVKKEDVQREFIKLAGHSPEGRAECVALCQKYGAKNVSSVPPTSYAALLADTRASLEKFGLK